MTQHYLFHEPGSIPGVPGQFAHCQVSVADDGTLTVVDLLQQPHEPQAVNTEQQPQNVTPAPQEAAADEKAAAAEGSTPAASATAEAAPAEVTEAGAPESTESEEA